MGDQSNLAQQVARLCFQTQLFEQASKLIRDAKDAMDTVELHLSSFALEDIGVPFPERFLVRDYARLLDEKFGRVYAAARKIADFIEAWGPVLDSRLSIFDLAIESAHKLGHQNELRKLLTGESPRAGSLDDIARQRRCRDLAEILSVWLARQAGYVADFEFEIRRILLGELFDLPLENPNQPHNRPLIRLSDFEALTDFFEEAGDDDYEQYGKA